MRHGALAPPGTMDFLFVSLISMRGKQGIANSISAWRRSAVSVPRVSRAPTSALRALPMNTEIACTITRGCAVSRKISSRVARHLPGLSAFTPLPGLLIDTAALVAGGYRRILFKP